MQDVDAGMHDHRIPDVEAGDQVREAVADARQDGRPATLQCPPDAIDRLGEEGLARQAQVQDLEQRARTALGRRHTGA